MAISPIHANQMDRLSNLPKELLVSILSLLPTHIAARTSVLCRRFQHLWEASPSLNLSRKDFPHPRDDKFLAMADCALRRDPSHPLLSFRLAFLSCRPIISSLILKACSFSLCHLDIVGCSFTHIKTVLPAIFSVKSLQSLSLPTLPKLYKDDRILASATSLTRLTTLSIRAYDKTTELNQLFSQLPTLQDLQLGIYDLKEFNISSHTIRKLKLTVLTGRVSSDILRLSLPLLESFHLENGELVNQFPTIHGTIPMLRKVFLNLDFLGMKDVRAVNGLLHFVSHAEELLLHMKEHEFETHPFPILFEQGQHLPNFPKLKHMDVSMCFHEDNFQAIVSMLQHSPVLESVRLVHKVPKFTGWGRKRKRKNWKSKLPRNAERNYRYVYFKNLHLCENREEFMNFLSKKRAPEKHASKRRALNKDLHNAAK